MLTCNWCGQHDRLNRFGYCDKCNETIRTSISNLKNELDKLENQAKPDIPDEEKQRIIELTTEYGNQLKVYKFRGVPFFKSSISNLCNRVFIKLGVDNRYPFDAIGTLNRKRNSIPVVLAIVFSWLITFSVMSANSDLTEYNNSLLTWIETDKELDEIQNTYMIQLENEIEKLQQEAETPTKAPTVRSYTLQNGNFVSGKNFTPGIYNITAISGGGNVSSDNAYNGGINAIMGVDDKDGFYQKQYKNISLPEGTTLSIDGVKVRLTLVE